MRLFVVLFAFILLSGCTTTPINSYQKTGSIGEDGTADSDVHFVKGNLYLDDKSYAYYTSLINIYGNGIAEHRFVPPIPPNDGIIVVTDPDIIALGYKWELQSYALVNFGAMSKWRQSAKAGVVK